MPPTQLSSGPEGQSRPKKERKDIRSLAVFFIFSLFPFSLVFPRSLGHLHVGRRSRFFVSFLNRKTGKTFQGEPFRGFSRERKNNREILFKFLLLRLVRHLLLLAWHLFLLAWHLFLIANNVTTSKALVTTSDAPVDMKNV